MLKETKIHLKEQETGKCVEALMLGAGKRDMPLKKDGWNFSWRTLFKNREAIFYKVVLKETPNKVEGMLMVTVLNGNMLFMNNLEVSPTNYGHNGKYDFVAGCLIAFACKLSFIFGKGNYLGFLSFESKTSLVDFYRDKYGATQANDRLMFFSDTAGKNLMRQYLNIEL